MVEQTINLSSLLEFFGLVLTIIISAIIITRAIKKGYQNYIDEKLKVVNMRVAAIEKESEDYKRQNQREHDSIKTEFNNTIQALDKKFGDLISLLESKYR